MAETSLARIVMSKVEIPIDHPPLHKVEDHPLPDDLFLLRRDVVLPLCLYNALPQVLEASALGTRSADVDHTIHFFLAFHSLGHLKYRQIFLSFSS